jgi:hypothetical protein
MFSPRYLDIDALKYELIYQSVLTSVQDDASNSIDASIIAVIVISVSIYRGK